MKAYLLVEVAQLLVLVRNSHALQIFYIPYCLEIPTDKKQVDFIVVSGFKSMNLAVDGVKFTVTTAFNCYLAGPLVQCLMSDRQLTFILG